MKTLVTKLTNLDFTLSGVSSAVVKADGETPTAGWTNPELGAERVIDGVVHFDFLAAAPTGPAADVITPISAHVSILLAGASRKVTVHSATNEMSVTLPLQGDPP